MDKLKFWERIGYSLFAIAGIAAVIGIGVAFDLGKSDWAAWVQAVGSIAAIFSAIWISNNQHEKERLQRAAQECEDSVAAFEAVAEMIQQASYFTKWATDRTANPKDTAKGYPFFPEHDETMANLEEVRSLIAAIPIHTPPYFRLARDIRLVGSALSKLQPILLKMKSAAIDDSKSWTREIDAIRIYDTWIDHALANVRARINRVAIEINQ